MVHIQVLPFEIGWTSLPSINDFRIVIIQPYTRFIKKMAGPQHHIFQSLLISYRLMPFHPWIITETPLPTRVSGVMKKGGLKPRKPCKTPGLSNGAFLKNPVKRPDSIGAGMGEETSKGVHFDFFRSCVSFRFKSLIQR